MIDNKKLCYLDYAATTPIDRGVLKEMMPYLKEKFGNPSSIHQWGQEAMAGVEVARQKVANFLNCTSEEIVFTGSATEANNLVIQGLIKSIKITAEKPHIITSQTEHDAILRPCEVLEEEGVAEVTYLPVNKEGFIESIDVKEAIKENTVLVSIMYANNEIGVIQPIAEIGKLIGECNQLRKAEAKIYFHTDAVQAVQYLNCNLNKLNVDSMTLSAHKIYGPKGVGALYIRRGMPVRPMILGGKQESGMRSGTTNAAGIIGLAAALKMIKNQTPGAKNKNIQALRDKLISGILKTIPDTRLNGSETNRLPNNVNISFKGVEGEGMVIALDQEGIAVATGSACSAKNLQPSHVLLALGLSHEEAHGSLRLTLGKYTVQREIDKVLKVLPLIVARLRKISGH